MKRIISILAAFILSIPLSALSITGSGIENPFPSLENIEKFDFASQDAAFDDITINLITTETGNEVFTYFGHTSLEIIVDGFDPIFYDYGFFTFSEGFYRNFIFGRLLYNIYATDGKSRIEGFSQEGRRVHRTALDSLSLQSRNALFSFLRYNARSENNTYLYDYYYDNCATRVRDIYNEATGGKFRQWASSINTGRTLREAANLSLDKNPIVSFTLNFLEGPDIDKPATLYDECFLPLELMSAVEEFENTESTIINDSGRIQYRRHSLNFYALIFSVSFFFASFFLYSSRLKALNRLSDIINGILCIYIFLLSSVLIFMMTATNHSVTYLNANFLYANPLAIVMTFEAFRGKRIRKRYYISFIELIIIALAFILKGMFPEVFIQDNLSVLMVMASLYLVNITHYFLLRERNLGSAS